MTGDRFYIIYDTTPIILLETRRTTDVNVWAAASPSAERAARPLYTHTYVTHTHASTHTNNVRYYILMPRTAQGPA